MLHNSLCRESAGYVTFQAARLAERPPPRHPIDEYFD